MGNKRTLAGIAILFFLFAAQAAAHGICRHVPYSDSLDAVRDGKAIPASRSLYWYMDEARAERAGIWACKPITSAFADVAAQAGIPSGIMTAVALNETSRHGMPWPWTLNAGGQSFYFDTRAEAYRAAAFLLRHRFTRFDIGIMQVDWKYNGWRFENAWQALQPSINMAAAANILRENREKTGSWAKAVELYHSADRSRGGAYLAAFMRHLRIVSAER